MKVTQCMGCRVCAVTHEGIQHGVRPCDDRLVKNAELSYCDDCCKNANLLVNMYVKIFGYADA